MKNQITFLLLLLAICLSEITFAKSYFVGYTKTYPTPSSVMAVVADGDTVEIAPGLYTGDVGEWTANNLLIRCTEGMAHIEAAGKNFGGKAIWVIKGNNTRIENIEFSGCTVPDHNGAGIRQEGPNLELRHCYFHDNEDGVLTSANDTSDILFEACEFARNGYGDGYSHNMYIGNVRSFSMRFCYSHHAKVGHCVKSRARNNFIEYNHIMDEDNGSASYLINLPNGGFSIILGNTMHKGVNAQNRTLVDYGSEGLSNPSKQLYVVNNTMVSQRPSGATFVSVADGTDSAKIFNNIFAGSGNILAGKSDTIANAFAYNPQSLSFADLAHYDFHIYITHTFWDSILASVAPHSYYENTFRLVPESEYVHPVDSSTWIGGGPGDQLNRGCFGIHINLRVSQKITFSQVQNFPNPFSEKTTINLNEIEVGSHITMNIYNPLGGKILAKEFTVEHSQIILERGNLAAGMYYYEIVNAKGERISIEKFIVQ